MNSRPCGRQTDSACKADVLSGENILARLNYRPTSLRRYLRIYIMVAKVDKWIAFVAGAFYTAQPEQ